MSQRKKKTKTSKIKSEIALDLRNCSDNYSGLKVSRSDLKDSPKKGICGTIIITEWVRPENPEMW